jgi:penicillin amidase
MAVVEFGPKIRAGSLLQFGQSADPKSPNYFDQGRLLSQQQLKPCLFYWDDVTKEAISAYHPGEQATVRATAGR